jgi:hypothetical protein
MLHRWISSGPDLDGLLGRVCEFSMVCGGSGALSRTSYVFI